MPVPEFGNIQIFCSISPEFPHSNQNIHEDKFFGKNRISEACNIDSERKTIFFCFLEIKNKFRPIIFRASRLGNFDVNFHLSS